jgi:predicted aspartyl protease
MPVVTFPSLGDCEVIEVDFTTLSGDMRRRQLLVDTGFTGTSSFVLGENEADFVHAKLESARATGALQGEQKRAWVTWQVPGLRPQGTSIAILTRLGPLSLPQGIGGMAGLTFLRNFSRWGAEETPGGWRFSVDDGTS